jgi:hypothetical protein
MAANLRYSLGPGLSRRQRTKKGETLGGSLDRQRRCTGRSARPLAATDGHEMTACCARPARSRWSRAAGGERCLLAPGCVITGVWVLFFARAIFRRALYCLRHVCVGTGLVPPSAGAYGPCSRGRSRPFRRRLSRRRRAYYQEGSDFHVDAHGGRSQASRRRALALLPVVAGAAAALRSQRQTAASAPGSR